MQPIFHWLALGLCVKANANFKFCVGREGFALDPIYQHVGIPNAYINMLVSPMQNSGVGGIAQRQLPTLGILCHSGI